jgi:hypothetical protein
MTQYAYPDDDGSVGNWLASTGTDRWEMINDDQASVSDSDYISSTAGGDTNTDQIVVTLTDISTPGDRDDHYIKYRTKGSGGMMGSTPTLLIELMEGSTVHKSDTNSSVGGSFGDVSITISSADAGDISDYSALTIRITRGAGGGGGGEDVFVSHIYLQCNDAAAGSSIAPIAMNTYKQMRGN